MNREMKFRAWDSEEKKMIFFELKDYQAIMGFIAYTGDFYTKLSIMQYTGLKGKDGKEIYDGSIILRDSETRCWVTVWNTRKAQWDLNDSRLTITNHQGFHQNEKWLICPLGAWSTKYVKVIGNIHENGDLLNGE